MAGGGGHAHVCRVVLQDAQARNTRPRFEAVFANLLDVLVLVLGHLDGESNLELGHRCLCGRNRARAAENTGKYLIGSVICRVDVLELGGAGAMIAPMEARVPRRTRVVAQGRTVAD